MNKISQAIIESLMLARDFFSLSPLDISRIRALGEVREIDRIGETRLLSIVVSKFFLRISMFALRWTDLYITKFFIKCWYYDSTVGVTGRPFFCCHYLRRRIFFFLDGTPPKYATVLISIWSLSRSLAISLYFQFQQLSKSQRAGKHKHCWKDTFPNRSLS